VPLLLDVLEKAMWSNKSVMIDVREPDDGHPFYAQMINQVIDIIIMSGINPSQVGFYSVCLTVSSNEMAYNINNFSNTYFK